MMLTNDAVPQAPRRISRGCVLSILAGAVLAISGCAESPRLPDRVWTPPGHAPRSACRADEVQWCRQSGTMLECTCEAADRLRLQDLVLP